MSQKYVRVSTTFKISMPVVSHTTNSYTLGSSNPVQTSDSRGLWVHGIYACSLGPSLRCSPAQISWPSLAESTGAHTS